MLNKFILRKKKSRKSKKPEILTAGGQAVIEGVMMRSKTHLAIAVRKPNGKISVKKEKIVSLADRIRILSLPFIRGIIYLFEMLIIGIKAINYSATEALEEDEEEISSFAIVLSLILAFGLAILLFKFIPLLIAQMLSNKFDVVESNYILFNLIDGAIKISLFILYLFFISFMEDIQRVFQYHGAEHKAVYCYEARKPLTVKNVQKFSPLHTRCGTSFILFVLVLSIFVYTFIPKDYGFWAKFGLRIAALPIIAGISYELLKFTGKHHKNPLLKIVIFPGLMIQKLTTRRPDDSQVEVAIKALKSVVKASKK